MHCGGFGGHFGRYKTYAMVHDKYSWPKMNRDVYDLLIDVKYAKSPKKGTTYVFVHSITSSFGTLGGHEHRFCIGIT